ncbi:MAG TPA: DUF364 domain-containing protein [Bellilinea sp.]|nr:DUF364 domain-containing protein [Bellilinea sp.]
MKLLEDLVASLPQATIHEVNLGKYWTLVQVENEGRLYGGLAATQQHGNPAAPASQQAVDKLIGAPVKTAAGLVFSADPVEVSIGMATINASLPREPQTWVTLNAEEYIREHGAGKKVVVVGHFPFIERIRPDIQELSVLELQPKDGDLPASAAPQVIPAADVVAITGMTLLNGTFDGLLELCRPETHCIVLGPSTPVSPLLFARGVDVLCGAIVEDYEQVRGMVMQGATMSQVNKAGGLRMITQVRPD